MHGSEGLGAGPLNQLRRRNTDGLSNLFRRPLEGEHRAGLFLAGAEFRPILG
jgi:hypothetical protein